VAYQAQTTGSLWGDLKEAVKRLSFDDFNRIGEIPCARKSFLVGIASGAGIGAVRGISVGPRKAAHWAVGTWMIVSIGTWYVSEICQSNLREERRKIHRVVEELPKRMIKK
ncbi:hypothetical protein K488DRAFT_27377, partial [Vararia minispora EC-137]